jgi:hypothetical protein
LERVAVIFKVEMVDRTAVARDARHPFVLGPFRLDDDSLSMVGRIARPPVDRGRNDETGCKCEIAKKRPVAGLKRKRKRPASLGRSRFRFEGNPKAHLRKPGSGRGRKTFHLSRWARYPMLMPTTRKSASPNVVFSKTMSPNTGRSRAGKKLMSSPLTKAPKTAPRRPPVALPNTPAVAPVKKWGTGPGMISGDT